MGGRYHRLRLGGTCHSGGGMDRMPYIIRGLAGRHCIRRKLSGRHHTKMGMDGGYHITGGLDRMRLKG